MNQPAYTFTLEWHPGPAQGGGGTAGKDANGVSSWYNGDRLMIIIDTNKGREVAVVDIDCDEDYFRVNDAGSGESYDAWGPYDWLWWAELTDKNMPPTVETITK